jgi:hypothetical protein
VVKLYVEGGGDTAALKAACREGFTTFITKTGMPKRPRVVACGSRRDAYESYCTAIANGEDAVLLVDSEAPIAAQHQQGQPHSWQPWQHLKQRQGDGWDKPKDAAETDCHFMAQCMEAWFLADHETLQRFFGQGFKTNQLPAAANGIEEIAKATIYESLANATRQCKTKAPYGKGDHSFKLLGEIDPAKITGSSPWAKRFIDQIKRKLGV